MLSNEEIRDRIINVTTMILNIDSSQIKNDSDFASDLGAESLQSVELVAGFEEEFEIEMDEEQRVYPYPFHLVMSSLLERIIH